MDRMQPFLIIIILFLVGASWVRASDLKTTCPSFNADETACKANSCHWCPCIPLCVSPAMEHKCVTGCVGFCDRMAECAKYGCVYDSKTGKCYDLEVETSVDFQAVCSVNDCNKDACIANGCRFCRVNRTCVPPNMSKGCDPGCRTHCRNSEECTAAGCIYDYDSGECTPDNKDYRYSVNFCGNETIDSKGIWYQRTDKSKIKFLRDNATNSYCYCNEKAVISLPDKELYKCTLASEEMEISIPIRDPGFYILGIHLAEIYKPTGRVKDITINGIVILKDFPLDSIGPVGTPYLATTKMEVNCALTELIVNGTKAPIPITNREVTMHFQVNPRFAGDTLHSVINAYYIQKVDS